MLCCLNRIVFNPIWGKSGISRPHHLEYDQTMCVIIWQEWDLTGYEIKRNECSFKWYPSKISAMIPNGIPVGT